MKMIQINCNSMDEVKEKIVESFATPRISIIKLGDQRMAVIRNCPNTIHDMFYLPVPLLLEGNKDELINEKIKIIREKGNDTVVEVHEFPVDLIDAVKILKFENVLRHKQSNKITSHVLGKIVSWREFLAIAEDFFYNFEKNDDLLLQICETKIYMGDLEFEAEFTESPINDKTIPVRTSTKLKDHCYYKDCMTALELCKYLLHYNITDAYDGFLTDGIEERELIMEYDEFGVEMRIYECQYGLYAEVVRGVFGKDVMQLVFIDNDFVRNNISKIHLIDANFIGLQDSLYKDEIYNYFKNLEYEEEGVKEKLLSLGAIDLRAIKHIKPFQDTDGKYVFAIGKHKIATFAQRHESWLRSARML